MNHPDQKPSSTGNDFLSELVIGMSDGLIVPFALTVGLSRVADSASMVAMVGMIALIAGAIVMGLGGYLTGKSEAGLYKPEQTHTGPETPASTAKNKEEVKTFLANLGLSEELQIRAADELTKEKKEWAELLREGEAPARQHQRQASKMGLNIGISYALGGLIPVGPYFFTETASGALKISMILTLIVLPALGYLRSRIAGLSPINGILRTTLAGSLAALGAFVVAKLFEQ